MKNGMSVFGEMGWPVLPTRGKMPLIKNWPTEATTDGEKINNWIEHWPDANFGIVTGERSGLFVLDIDPRNGGDHSLDLLQHEHGELPETLVCQTQSGGLHYYFNRPFTGAKSSAEPFAKGIDIKCDGGYVLLPPSASYSWLDAEPGEVQLAEVPEWILEKLNCNKKSFNGNGNGHNSILEGERNSKLASIAGTYRAKGLSHADIEVLLQSENLKRCQPPLNANEVSSIAKSISSYPAPMTVEYPPPLGEDAFRGIAGDLVRKIEPHTEADSSALLIQFLTAFGNIIGRNAYFFADGTKHYTNLFALLVGRTSKGRKGSAWNRIRSLLKELDENWSIEGGLSSGEGLLWAIRDEITKIVKGEEIVDDPGIADKRALVLESEFAQVLKVFKREGNSLSPIIRNAWDCQDTLKSMTKNSPAKVTDPHISLVGHISKEELHRVLDETEIFNGLMNRFLFTCVSRSKLLPEGGRISEEDFYEITLKLKQAVDFASQVGEMRRDDLARARWAEIYRELSAEHGGLFGSAIGRAEAQTLRLSCIYALLDSSAIVRVEHLESALAVWRYCENSAKFIFGTKLGDPIADEIKALLDNSHKGLSRTEISNYFGRNKSSEQISRAIQVLTKKGSLRSTIEKTNGRNQTKYFGLNS